jgi:hypothetical protein
MNALRNITRTLNNLFTPKCWTVACYMTEHCDWEIKYIQRYWPVKSDTATQGQCPIEERI